jgi:hypothetical protein
LAEGEAEGETEGEAPRQGAFDASPIVEATGATLPVITTRYLIQPPVNAQVSEAIQWWKFTPAASGGYFCSTAGVASVIAAMGDVWLESNAHR